MYCVPEKYPLAYLRRAGEEEILVALNPSGKEVCCKCPYEVKERIYTLGKPAKTEAGVLCLPAESAAFLKCAGNGGKKYN